MPQPDPEELPPAYAPLKDHVDRLNRLLREPQPKFWTWRNAVAREAQAIANLYRDKELYQAFYREQEDAEATLP